MIGANVADWPKATVGAAPRNVRGWVNSGRVSRESMLEMALLTLLGHER
jgi:hypothetical protein